MYFAPVKNRESPINCGIFALHILICGKLILNLSNEYNIILPTQFNYFANRIKLFWQILKKLNYVGNPFIYFGKYTLKLN